jgi:hypothetical protein
VGALKLLLAFIMIRKTETGFSENITLKRRYALMIRFRPLGP